MSEADGHAGADEAPSRPAPRLNERILSSLSRRSVAAHPWHDLEIGETEFSSSSQRHRAFVFRWVNCGCVLLTLENFCVRAPRS
jgi:hypothetical protein